MPQQSNLTFNISLTVLNSLGRNLYRNFITIIGEAISNAWDADATTVKIKIDRESNTMAISDNGIGMSLDDFTKKFLKVGYSKRRDGAATTQKGRPFIGRKGIGKLALLSCAKRVTIISKTTAGTIIGGTIDNGDLDVAIQDDLDQSQYALEPLTPDDKNLLLDKSLDHGTIIRFTDLKDSIRNTEEYIRKAIALYFRFSLIDPDFKIFLNDNLISFDDIDELVNKTEFLWTFNNCEDPLANKISSIVKSTKFITTNLPIRGFIASAKKPRDLKIMGADEKVGIDLFVNGRLREYNMLKHIQTARIPESYLYGQIHFDDLDDGNGKDRFTSSREGIVADDELFQNLLDELREIIKSIIDEWDDLRLKNKEDGDSENTGRMSAKDRASHTLYNEASKEYCPTEGESQDIVQRWIDDLDDDAAFNIGSYTECFISENLVRKYVSTKGLPLNTPELEREIEKWRRKEKTAKELANLSIPIRDNNDDLYYLDMEHLCKTADPQAGGSQNHLVNDEKIFTPLRNAVMHTSRLTGEAKTRLTTVYDNIKAKIKALLERQGNDQNTAE